MFRMRAPALALGALLLVGTSVSAATNTWAPGFPKVKAGVIKIKGTATADAGFTLGKTGTAVVWRPCAARCCADTATRSAASPRTRTPARCSCSPG